MINRFYPNEFVISKSQVKASAGRGIRKAIIEQYPEFEKYADELFRFWLSFRIESPELVEPTDLEITGRYFGWGAMLIGIFVVFVIGLS